MATERSEPGDLPAETLAEHVLPPEALDLEVPPHWVAGVDVTTVVKDRVTHHLVQAMNALDEAAHYTTRTPYLPALNIVHAVLEAIVRGEEAVLQPLHGEAVKTLADLKATKFVGSNPSELASSKVDFLRLVRCELEPFVDDEVQTDGRLAWKSLQIISDGTGRARKAPSDQVTACAQALITALFFDEKFIQLHGARASNDHLKPQSERFARVLAHLVAEEQATPLQVARAALFVLGVSSSALKNFFHEKVIEKSQLSTDAASAELSPQISSRLNREQPVASVPHGYLVETSEEASDTATQLDPARPA